MTRRRSKQAGRSSRWMICLAALAVAAAAVPPVVWAFGFQQAVGGIFIDPRGIVSNAHQDQIGQLRLLRIKEFHQVPGGLNQSARLR
ncbi:MAG TPA: hypothetical protein VGN42_28905, partial [Pirellulales bacterium]|nr:hypothetical protein [Pirellulales bacterium]